ncbi:hypothetical protein J2T21_003532 [Paeniglutamicibacter psychrophenolicus]|nr:hypothetical protein [Paeniglutamicibacter psychrophenolicus]
MPGNQPLGLRSGLTPLRRAVMHAHGDALHIH